jgi:hypothetical protein
VAKAFRQVLVVCPDGEQICKASQDQRKTCSVNGKCVDKVLAAAVAGTEGATKGASPICRTCELSCLTVASCVCFRRHHSLDEYMLCAQLLGGKAAFGSRRLPCLPLAVTAPYTRTHHNPFRNSFDWDSCTVVSL